jgi:Rrf2 family iron-sulfur cluster assembly transcriptional regulator
MAPRSPRDSTAIFFHESLDASLEVIYYQKARWPGLTVDPAEFVMPLLPRKGILAVAAVIDIALHARGRPVAAKALAARHRLPPRHLEPVLQALVRHGILKGVRGPRGGYQLARQQRRISADDILRAAGTADDTGEPALTGPGLLNQVVMPALAQAEQAFSVALARINVEDLVRSTEAFKTKIE